jgi:hypothetical protein
MIAACGDERGLFAIALGDFEAENTAIESQSPLDVGHLEVDMADADAGINLCRHLLEPLRCAKRE